MNGSPAGLPPKARLRSAAEFAALRQASGRQEARHFLVRYRANAEQYPRLGIAVSRRVSKKAVERNRVKRMVRESFRRARLPALDVLIIARAHAATIVNPDLRSDLERVWSRLQALKAERGPGTIAD